MTTLTLDRARFPDLAPDALAYGSDPERRLAAIEIAREHELLDRIRQGVYWGKDDDDVPRGCLIGCMTHSAQHSEMQARYGIPETLAWLCDRIFEALPTPEAPSFVPAVMEAIPAGSDLSGVLDRWRLWMLRDLLGLLSLKDDVWRAVQGMGDLFARRVAGDEPSEGEWGRAAEAARAALEARTVLATRYTGAVWACRAAEEACVVKSAGDAVAAKSAWAAEDAWLPRDARRTGATAWGRRAREELLRLLRDAPVVGADVPKEDK